MSDQELIELGKRRATELGLMEYRFIYAQITNGWTHGYSLKDVHHLLGSATEVYNAHSAQGLEYAQGKDRTWFPNLTHTSTVKALLIGITELKVATREEKLEALLRSIYERDQRQRFIYDATWEIAAKQLLNERGEK